MRWCRTKQPPPAADSSTDEDDAEENRHSKHFSVNFPVNLAKLPDLHFLGKFPKISGKQTLRMRRTHRTDCHSAPER